MSASLYTQSVRILGAAPAAYDLYAVGVAQECVPVVGEAAYRQVHTALLRRTLAAEAPLFHTAPARDALEAPARGNMLRELQGLADRKFRSEATGALPASAP